jgi:isopenicillin-N epimerase
MGATLDWTGTPDPSAVLALPAARRAVGGLDEDGWPGFMATNRSLALRGRELLCSALGVAPPAPDAMIGSMAAVPLSGLDATPAAAERLQGALFAEERIEVPITLFPVAAAVAAGAGPPQALVRISAQRYNRVEEYARLAEALAKRLRGPSSPRALLGRLRRG